MASLYPPINTYRRDCNQTVYRYLITHTHTQPGRINQRPKVVVNMSSIYMYYNYDNFVSCASTKVHLSRFAVDNAPSCITADTQKVNSLSRYLVAP